MSSFTHFFLITFLIFNYFSFAFSENFGCLYQDTKDGEILITDGSYLNSSELNKRRKDCFSLSYSKIFQQQCCYDNENQICTSENNTAEYNISCPLDSVIPNNCGMAGIYQPETPDTCTGISLVEGYCCFLDFGIDGKVCIKTNKLNDDKNSSTEMITNYIQTFRNNNKRLNLSQIVCESSIIKIASKILLIGLILLI